MLDLLLMALLVVFGLGAGFFIGTGNRGGVFTGVIAGLVAGLLLSIPALRESLWMTAGVLAAAVTIGSLVATFVPDHNRFKRLCREQGLLVVRIGSYQIGKRG